MAKFWENAPLVEEGGQQQGTQPVFTIPDPGAARDNAREDARDARDARAEQRTVDDSSFDRASKLRTEFLGLPDVKAFRDVQNSTRQIVRLAERESSAMGDLGLVFSYMKALDPGSTVREGEFATAQNATGIPGAIRNAYNQMISGERLSDEQRQDMAGTATSILNSRAEGYNDLARTYQGLLQAEGADPAANGVTLFEVPEATQEPRVATTQDAVRDGAEVRLGMDSWGGNDVFDRLAYLEDTFGIGATQEARLSTSLNNLSGSDVNSSQIAAIYGKLDIPLPSQDKLDGMAESLRQGERFSGFDTADAEQQYLDGLRALNSESPRGEEERLLQQGASWGLSDELAGVEQAIYGGLRGQSPVAGYQVGRDAERLALEEARANQGAAGIVGEVGAGLATGGVRTLPALARAGVKAAPTAINEARAAGAIAGYGYGEGLGGSAAGAAMGAVAGDVAARGISKAGEVLSRRRGGAAQAIEAPATGGSQRSSVQYDIPAEGARTAPPSLPQESQQEVAKLAKQATGRGLSAAQAREKLAKEAVSNPEAKAAADRLGVSLPPDILSDSAQLQSLTGLARSQVGSEAETAWRRVVEDTANRANSAIEELGGGADLSQISDDVFARLNAAAEGLQAQASKLRDEVTASVKPTERVDAVNIQREVASLIEEYGGLFEAKAAMTPQERSLLQMLGEGEEALRPTYSRLNRLRDDIGEALSKNSGAWADVNRAQLSKYYKALSDDQLGAIEQIGGAELADKQRAANSLFAKMFNQRAEMQDLFGKNLEKSIAPLARRALTAGSKGDTKDLDLLLNRIPENIRGSAIMSAMFSQARSNAFHGGFSFSNYAKMYRGLRENSKVYSRISKAVGKPAEQVLRDLYAISNRMAAGENYVLKTGKSNQALLAEIQAESLIGKILGEVGGRAATGAGAAVGGFAGGPGGAMAGATVAETARTALTGAGTSRLDKVHKLFVSDEFNKLIAAISRGEKPDSFDGLWNSPAFHKLGKSLGYASPSSRRDWLKSLSNAASVTASNVVDFPRMAASQMGGPARLAAEEQDSTTTTGGGTQ